jgi:hypothetical protein
MQFVLLRFGEPHGLTDQAGVILTVLQWLLLGWALRTGANEAPETGSQEAAPVRGRP